MARGPDKPGDIYSAYLEDVRRAFGDELEALIAFGDAVTGDYVPTRSYIEFLIAVVDDSFARVKAFAPTVASWHKRRVATPMIVSPGYVQGSLDAAPIVLLNMCLHHEVVAGNDVLSRLEFDPEQLRIGCEHEAKDTLQWIKRSFLDHEGELKQIERAMAGSIDHVVAILRTLIHLRGKEAPGPRARVFKEAGKIFNLSEAVFAKVLRFRDEELEGSKADRDSLFEDYVGQLEAIARIADELVVVEAR